MAMAKTDGTVTDIEGKFGGVVFRTDVCGQHIQAAPRPSKQQYSDEHMKVLDCFHAAHGFFDKYYRDPEWQWPPPPYPLDEVIDAWQLYASCYPRKTKKGRTYFLSWYQMYMSYNMTECLADRPFQIIPLPPD